MASCDPLTNTRIAEMLAFRTCDGGQVLPGEALATCADLQTAIDGLDIPGAYGLVDVWGNPVPNGGCVVTCSDFQQALTELDSQFAGSLELVADELRLLAEDGTLLSTITLPADDLGGVSLGFDTTTNTLTLLDSANNVLDTVDLSSLAGGGGGSDGVITNVELTGTDLVFTGSGGAFNGAIDLSTLPSGGGSDGVVTNVELVGDDLTFTGTGGAFNGTVDLSAYANQPIDMVALATALCAVPEFRECVAQIVLGAFQLNGTELVIADGTDGSGGFTFTPCP
jgi:hypothetical protein